MLCVGSAKNNYNTFVIKTNGEGCGNSLIECFRTIKIGNRAQFLGALSKWLEFLWNLGDFFVWPGNLEDYGNLLSGSSCVRMDCQFVYCGGYGLFIVVLKERVIFAQLFVVLVG